MKEISLSGQWKLYYYPEHEASPQNPEALYALGLTPLNATVPGNVELDLMAAGIEEDPYYGINSLNYRKYEFYSWWFERGFDVPQSFNGEDVILRFDGIDTFGTVFINGQKVGESANMLIPHEFNITPYLAPGGKNTITVHISSTVNKARAMDFPVGSYIWDAVGDEYPAIRKPSHMFGWDIAARLVSAGLWRDVAIFPRGKTYIKEVYYATFEHDAENANVVVRYRFQTDDPYLEGFTVKVAATHGDETHESETPCTFVSGNAGINIVNPKLWWPVYYGSQPLYRMTFTLLKHGKVIDVREENFGIRTIKLLHSFDNGGEFKFLVNGVPIMVKGVNWVPLDCLHSRDKERLPSALALLKDSNCNMVRMWGGNVYEQDEFFDYCDENGIMVWQDFAMACAVYNQSDDFCKQIEEEAAAIAKRLRNRPSLAIWAGDNEVDIVYRINKNTPEHSRYNRVTREVLPRVLGMHDPYREYLPSSPVIENADDDLNMPEQHNWGPRDYYKGEFHKNCTARFIGETGYHGCPAVSSLKKFIPAEELWPFSEESTSWKMHNSHYYPARPRMDRNELMFRQVKTMFGHIPEKMEDAVLASQITQAEAVKFLIENTRIQKWQRTGILWWNLIDGWLQTSDSVVDYYYVKKLAYYYIKRVQQPLLLLLGEPDSWQHRVCLANDSNRAYDATYTIIDYDNKTVVASGKAHVPANENIDLPPIPCLPGEQKLYLLEWEADGVKYGNHYAAGYIPMNFERYKQWLGAIMELPEPFEI